MPTITPQFEITINTRGGKRFSVPAIKRIEVKTSRRPEPDTATIELPSMNNLSLDTFKKGDEVEIKFGHLEEDAPASVFLGQILRVGSKLPVSLECEDFLGNLKRCWYKSTDMKNPASPSSSESISIILQNMISNAGDGAEGIEGIILLSPTDFNEVKWYGELPIGNRKYGEVIEDLLKHGWDLFMLPGTKKLFFGPRNTADLTIEQHQTPIFRSGLNNIELNLKNENETGIRKVEVRVSSKDRKSKTPEATWEPEDSDRNGETKKIEIPGITKAKAAYYAKLFYDINSKKGLSGDIRTFGLGWYKHWMKCKIELGPPMAELSQHHFPSGIDYLYSSSDGLKMTVFFENSRQAA